MVYRVYSVVSFISKENVMKPSQLFIVIFLLLLVLSACSPIDAVATNDFSISASPINLTIPAGSNSDTMINTAILTGAAGTVSLSVSGLPAGITAAFNAVSVAAGGSSKLTFKVASTAAPGTYHITVTGTEGAMTHIITLTVTVLHKKERPKPTPCFRGVC